MWLQEKQEKKKAQAKSSGSHAKKAQETGCLQEKKTKPAKSSGSQAKKAEIAKAVGMAILQYIYIYTYMHILYHTLIFTRIIKYIHLRI